MRLNKNGKTNLYNTIIRTTYQKNKLSVGGAPTTQLLRNNEKDYVIIKSLRLL